MSDFVRSINVRSFHANVLFSLFRSTSIKRNPLLAALNTKEFPVLAAL